MKSLRTLLALSVELHVFRYSALFRLSVAADQGASFLNILRHTPFNPGRLSGQHQNVFPYLTDEL